MIWMYIEDQLSSGTFFQTQDHADQIMMGVYSQMQSDDIFGRQFGLDCLGGIGSGYDPASYAVIGRGTYNSTSGLVTGKIQKSVRRHSPCQYLASKRRPVRYER